MATCIRIDENLNVRENFKQEALDSWRTYQATGRHVTGNEVRVWLNTWGSEAKAEQPPLHI